MTSVVISGSGVFTPPHVVSNEELVDAYNQYVDIFNREHEADIADGKVAAMGHSSCGFIEKASGIKSRFVMYKEGITDPKVLRPVFAKRGKDEVPEMVEMAEKAAAEALRQAGRTADEVDMVICAASNMQRSYPSLAVQLQQRIGAGGFAFDMNVACSSATFAAVNAINAIKTGMAKVALVVNPEFASPQLNYKNRDSHFIFGDVCTAMVLEAEEGAAKAHAFRVLGSALKTQFSNNINCQSSYTDHCFDELPEDNAFFSQEGRKVFKELLPIVCEHIFRHLDQMQLSAGSLKRLWLHQANLSMNQFAVKKVLGCDEFDTTVAPLVLDKYANTASAGSIIAFHQHKADFEPGDKGFLCSFGAGYSVGSLGLEKL